MRILVSNDDGYDAPGIQALAEAVEALGEEVWVVAPDREQSAMSHSLTLQTPLRARPRGPRRYAVSGTPADCIYLALHGLLDGPPDLVVSGINHGSNLSSDVHYSGTVAAAREACLGGVPAIAFSLHFSPDDEGRHWETAQEAVRRLVPFVAERGLPKGTLLNCNVPNIPLERFRGLKAVGLGRRTYEQRVMRRDDPWGRPYYWIGGGHLGFEPLPGTDGPAVEQGYAPVTPLHSDPTLYDHLEMLRDELPS